MKEWAEADNQSKNLPKSERQALNEVFMLHRPAFLNTNQRMKLCPGDGALLLLNLKIFPLPALPVCAADSGGAGGRREAETGGDSPRQSGSHTQQQPAPGPGELPDCRTVRPSAGIPEKTA